MPKPKIFYQLKIYLKNSLGPNLQQSFQDFHKKPMLNTKIAFNFA